MSKYNTKNYTEQGGEVTHIGGVLEFGDDATVENFPGAENMSAVTGSQVKDVKDALNELLIKLKNANIMTPDQWNLSVLACPTPEAMPTTETASNSSHATVSIENNLITVTLNCVIEDLEDADHGSTWGEHKWLGFGVRTGLSSLEGITFTDDTGASVVLSSADETEATALGLSAGDFVLYIKAEDFLYIVGRKFFVLSADGMEKDEFYIRIIETWD